MNWRDWEPVFFQHRGTQYKEGLDKQRRRNQAQVWTEVVIDYINADPALDFSGIYSDKKSGTTENRPGFQSMIDDAVDGKIDRILCKSISRFSRNIVDALHYIEVLSSHGINVIFLKEHLDTATGSTRIILRLMAVLAQNESQSISDNVRSSNLKRVENGSIGSRSCFGHDVVDGKLVPNADADTVRLIFSLAVEGNSYQKIANVLHEQLGKPFTSSGIRYILRNEAYKGDRALLKQQRKGLFDKRRDGKNTVYLEQDHEGIVDREVRERAQHINHSQNSSLAGRVFCSECGSPMVRRTLRGKDGYYKAWGCPHHCGSRNVKEEKIINFLKEQDGAVGRIIVGKDITVEQA